MEFLATILLIFFVIVALLLIGMVLIQDEQGDGLAGMFGGGSQSTFGSRAGNVLTRTTSVLGGLFIIVAIGLAWMYKTPETGDVAAAARQQNAATEWWNAAPPAPAVTAPAPEAPAAPGAKTAAGPAAAVPAPANASAKK